EESRPRGPSEHGPSGRRLVHSTFHASNQFTGRDAAECRALTPQRAGRPCIALSMQGGVSGRTESLALRCSAPGTAAPGARDWPLELERQSGNVVLRNSLLV